VETTTGRVILREILPETVPFAAINKVMTKKELTNLVDTCYRLAGNKETVILADRLKEIGFRYSTIAGISICINDMVIPEGKPAIIDKATEEVKEIQNQYTEGLITDGERYNKVIDIWAKANEEIGKEMLDNLSRETVVSPDGVEVKSPSFNAIHMMADSGSRGSAAQIQAGVDWSPSPIFLAHLHLLARTDDGHSENGHAGTPEAYLQARFPVGESRVKIQAGAFFLPTSRENVDALWENPYAVSSSALNSWFGEEFRPVGLDVSWTRWGATIGGTLFRGNDTLGALPLDPGWSLHDRWILLGQKVQTGEDFTSVSAENDHRLGWSARAGWSSSHLSVLFTHIDNRSDGLPHGDFYDWNTRFDVAGFGWRLLDGWLRKDRLTSEGRRRRVELFRLLGSRRARAHRRVARRRRIADRPVLDPLPLRLGLPRCGVHAGSPRPGTAHIRRRFVFADRLPAARPAACGASRHGPGGGCTGRSASIAIRPEDLYRSQRSRGALPPGRCAAVASLSRSVRKQLAG
jgi:hypothetical protein